MSKINPRALQALGYAASAARGIGKAEDAVAGAISKTIVGAAKNSRLTKKTEPGIQNLWTGRREGAGAITIGAALGVGYVGYSTFKQTSLGPKTGEISYTGTAPGLNADGVSSATQAPTLGAGGNMVFGLHNARKGS